MEMPKGSYLDHRASGLYTRRAFLGRGLVLTGALVNMSLAGCSSPHQDNFTGRRDQIQLVEGIAEGLYRDLAKSINAPYEEVHTYNYCIDLSPKLMRGLKAQNFNAFLLQSPLEFPLDVFVGLDNDWIADPTWQQFVIPARPDLPKVLVVHRDQLPQKLADAGVRNLQPIWLRAQIRDSEL